MPTSLISSKDTIYVPRTPSQAPKSKQSPDEVLIYFIPGNPGLINFYHTFVSHLASLLDPEKTGLSYHVVGHSLGGYELSASSGVEDFEVMLTGSKTKLFKGSGSVLGLREQEDFVFRCLWRTVNVLRRSRSESGDGDVYGGKMKVILVGHSVGAYILMQNLVARQRQQLERPEGEEDGFEIVAGVGLFPTIVDLAGSPRGRMLAPLGKLKWFALTVQMIASILWLIPASLVQQLVQLITGMPTKAAAVTTGFLQSRHGVYQALHMARDELLEMTTDKWPETIWNRGAPLQGTNAENVDRPKLYFFWGNDDHWIDNATRGRIIAQRARRPSVIGLHDNARPRMEVDGTGIPHDFCLHEGYSRSVAKKVIEFVNDACEA